MVLAVILGLAVVLAVVALVYAAHSGLFHKINVTTGPPPIGKFTGAYKFFTGPYSNSGKTFGVLSEICPDKKCFGVWYDDPGTVAPEKLRWITGTILAEEDEKPDMETFKKLEEKGYKMKEFPRVNRVIKTSFPNVNMLSILLAVFRVYNAIGDYGKEKGLEDSCGPFMDVYDSSSAVNYFTALLDHNDDFLVPEAKSAS